MKRRPSSGDILLTALVSAAAAPPQMFFYGGQAVIEGVLMRGPRHFAVAARKPDGQITLCQDVLKSRVYTSRTWRLPFIRGVAGLYEMLNLGMRALQWSAAVQMGDEVELSPNVMRVTVGFSVVFALALFLVLPLVAGQAIRHGSQSTGTILLEGAIRVAVLLGYLFLIGQIRSVKRVFEYHGSEHKAINCLEFGGPLDVDHVRQASRLHPRCGTGFILVVAFISIIVFTPLGGLNLWLRLFLQILLVPVVAGISYEAIRFLAKHRHSGWGKVALVPILATQRLSTREPDNAQIEVAIAALQAARQSEEEVGEAHDPTLG